MDGLTCDACNEGLLIDADARYIVRVEGFAAYDPLEITRADLAGDLEAETGKTIEELRRLDADTAQDQVHRSFQFDLCPRCWGRYVRDPLSGIRPRGGDNKEKSQGD
jgi:hypothetical protein